MPSSPSDAPAELELGLYRWDSDHYGVDLRFDAPGEEVSVRPRQSRPVAIDFARLRGLQLDATAYGEQLWRYLFADDGVRDTFHEAVAQVLGDPERKKSVRVRLYVSPNAPELHSLRWELLRDPVRGAWLATDERVLFSRYALSADWRPSRPPVEDPADRRALLVIANPSNLDSFRPGGRELTPVPVADERRRARQALAGLRIEELSGLAEPPRGATLDALAAGLRDGCDVLYLVCHGTLPRGEPVLFLEADNGGVDPVTGTELLDRLRALKELPRLVILASCQSAGTGSEARTGDEGALAALGPRLAEAGIPAVLAMQGNVGMDTVAAFMPSFLTELRRDGAVDRAAAAARAAVVAGRRPDWWAPSLFLRLRGASLWGRVNTVPDPGTFTDWEPLVANLQQGLCTAVLGWGMLEPLIGPSREVARRWAEIYRFPLAANDRDDLPQVAQFLKVTRDRNFPRAELDQYLRRLLRQRFAALADVPKTASLDDLMLRCGRQLQEEAQSAEPHLLLSRLPFPVFITTNAESLLADTLARTPRDDDPARRKEPQVALFSSSNPGPPPAKPPTAATPWVYHLFGRFDRPKDLVLTEDDYFDFLLGVSGRRRLIPPEVLGALTGTSLVFLGFRLEEWDFRVLVQSIKSLEGSELLHDYVQVAVQIDPAGSRFLDPASARRYLQRLTDFAGKSLSIYWGNLEQFLTDLRRHYQARVEGA